MRVYLFDIDGTLISSGGAGKAALEAALAAEFGRPPDLGGVTLGGRTDRGIARDVLEHHGLDASPAGIDRYLAAYLAHLPRTLRERPGRVLPGIEPLLAELLAWSEAAVGLLTGNVVAGAETKLAHYGLWGRFAFGGFGDRHHDRNDVARDALASAETFLGRAIDREQVWVIGDTPHDVTCARAIGARALAVATGSARRAELAETGADLVVDDLSDPAVGKRLRA